MRLPETWMVPLAAELVAAATEDVGVGEVEDEDMRERDYTERVVRVVAWFMCWWWWWYKLRVQQPCRGTMSGCHRSVLFGLGGHSRRTRPAGTQG